VKKKLTLVVNMLFGMGIILLGYSNLNAKKQVINNKKYLVVDKTIQNKDTLGQERFCDTIFTIGEVMPKFRGGDSALLEYNMKKIAPLIKKSNTRTGNLLSKLIYSLTISKEGKILESEILSKVDKQLEITLKNELVKMPNWIPGKVNDRTECMEVRVPITCLKWE